MTASRTIAYPHLVRLCALTLTRPRNEAQLHAWVRSHLGLDVPRTPVVPGSTPPMAYLSATFFESGRDLAVWAPRGGGKTMLGAAATVLDLLFKPGIQVRILGGSLEQSSRMHEYVLSLFDRPALRGVLRGEPTARRVETLLRSRAAISAGSHRSVRGVRVQKMRCDEVDDFDPSVWAAAQLVTRSARCGGQPVHGTVEALSTMHRTDGVMRDVLGSGAMSDLAWGMAEAGSGDARPFTADVFRWTALDVAARCEPDRPCDTCVLYDDCRGRAKAAAGFVPIDDLVRQWRRTSRETWSAEMMCRAPAVRERVYEEFDPTRHVRAEPFAPMPRATLVGGMDFGWRSPTVFLWARADGEGDDVRVHVIDEYTRRRATLDDHLDAIAARPWGDPAWIGVDPAGRAGNTQTGRSDVQALRRRGHRVRWRAAPVRVGVEAVRAMLDRDRLTVHPRCRGLIDALRTYHFDPDRPRADEPVKDGPDHFCDALRYLVTHLRTGPAAVAGNYLYGS